MHTLAIDQPFPGLQRGTPDGSHYSFDASGHTLLVVADRPSSEERAAFRGGALGDVAVLVDGPVILLCWRLGGGARGWSFPWSEAPYSWHLVPEASRVVPPAGDALAPGSRALLQLVLADERGVVRGLRTATLSPEVTAALHGAIAAQAAAPWDPRAYDAHLQRLMGAESATLAARATVRCALGA
jgi:hypothetical protein